MNKYINKIILPTIIALLMQISNANAALTCSIVDSILAFGIINPFDTNVEQTTTTITVTCTAVGPRERGTYRVTFDGGSSGNTESRVITNANTINTLIYQMSKTLNQNNQLGSGANNKIFRQSYDLTNATATFNHTIFGQMPVQSGAVPGVYTDKVTVTVTY